MDYSLLLGIHDCNRAEQERAEQPPDNGDIGEEDEDSEDPDRMQWCSTPPDSPHTLMREISLQYDITNIIPELDIYAIPSADSKYRHPSPLGEKKFCGNMCSEEWSNSILISIKTRVNFEFLLKIGLL